MKLPPIPILPAMLAAGLLLAGCDQIMQRDMPADPEFGELVPPAPAPGEAEPDSEAEGADLPVRPETASTDTAIDWDAARRDLAARPIEDREAGAFQIASGGSAPPVPVFLPSAPFGAASADGEGVRFQQMRDGYYAFFPGETWDAVVNGTNRVIAAPGESTAPRTDDFQFLPTTTGAQVAFSRYGADYLVEFECKELTGGLPTCISEEDALAFAEELVITGTR